MFAALNSFLTRAVSGYFLNKSLRFRSSASAYLNRTPATATNRTTWTWSAWVKLGTLGVRQEIFCSINGAGNDYILVEFETDNTFFFGANDGSAVAQMSLATTQVFRDPAAWYHLVVVLDTTQATAANRAKIYFNGTQVTALSTATYPPQNYSGRVNTGNQHNVGSALPAAGLYFDGEMAEVNFVDGQALAPTSFGASSIYNQWLPIRYAGTYGTNGFYLPFNAGTSGYASYFNGTNSYVTVAANAAFTVPSSTSFTIEAFIYITNLPYANGNIICANSSTSSGYAFLYNPTIGLRLYAGGGTVDINQGSVTGWVANTWYHVAAVRNGASAITLYRNGVSVATGSSTSSFGTGAYFVGASPNSPDLAYMNGYISNFRLVNGTAVYTTTFTPPTAPLTAVTNTALLTLQNATFVDNSTNNFTVSNFGSAALGQTYPFAVSQFNDASGNSNNWTNNNVSGAFGSTLDYLTDVPTLTSTTVANYAVLNPLQKGGSVNPSSGNLQYLNTATAYFKVFSTIGITSGKWYVEYVIVASSAITNGRTAAGLARYDVSTSDYFGFDTYSWGSINTPGNNVYNSNIGKALTTGAFVAGDVLMLAYDADAGKLWFGVKGAWDNGNDPSTGSTPSYSTNLLGSTGPFFFGVHGYTSPDNTAINFGQQPFTYTAPTGFLPLNTFNI